jgi:hypothetical protein
MDFEADIRLVVRVPFRADVDELSNPRDPDAAARVDEQRVNAAKHAETELLDRVRQALDGHGEVIAEVVEEVRER